jgi:hypothetical protein
MHRRLGVLVLVSLAIVALPMAASALSLDVEAKGGAGIGLGTTDNKDITGQARLAADGGVGVDLFLFSLGPVEVGLSTGVEYSYLTFHSTWKNLSAGPLGTTDFTSDATYNYINVPIALVGRYSLNPSLKIVGRVGAFVGYFLNGKSDNTYKPEIPLAGLTDGSTDLDSSNTIRMEYGLHVTGGVDIGVMQNVAVEPALQFDMGLTDTSKNSTGNDFKDTFWSLTVAVGIKYNAL